MSVTPQELEAENNRQNELFENYLKDNIEVIRESLAWKEEAKGSVETRAYLYQLCSDQVDTAAIMDSIIFWINHFGYIQTPKNKRKSAPFLLFEFQKEAIRSLVEHIENGGDLLIEKSREMGVTWLIVYVSAWYWLFRPGTNILLGSYKEMLVDDKTIDSMFGKLEYVLDGLPSWMLPRKFKKDKHRTKLKLINPDLNNYITGDTMNEHFGRGARKTFIFFDEHGFWDYAKGAWESSGDTTNCRISNSTPHGNNYYAMLARSGMDKLTLLWKQNPLKDTQWYEFQCKRRTAEEVAQEIDISYTKSREGRVYQEWNENNVVNGKFEYDDNLPLYVGWDFGRADGTAIIWVQRTHDGRLVILDTYYKTNKLIDYFAPLITGDMLTEYQYQYDDDAFKMIEKHKTWKKAVHFGDPAGEQKTQNADRSVIDVLRTYGIHVNVYHDKKTHAARKSSSKRLIMDGIDVDTNSGNSWLDICMNNYSYPKVKREGIVQVNGNVPPKHDEYSHVATAFEYLAVGLENIKSVAVKVYDKFKKTDRYDNRGTRRSIGY